MKRNNKISNINRCEVARILILYSDVGRMCRIGIISYNITKHISKVADAMAAATDTHRHPETRDGPFVSLKC